MVILRLHAITAWAFASSVADASLIVSEGGRAFEPAYRALLALSVGALIAAALIPAIDYASKVLLRLAWVFIKLAARVIFDEIVKWVVLAGAASLGLLHLLEWLPALPLGAK